MKINRRVMISAVALGLALGGGAIAYAAAGSVPPLPKEKQAEKAKEARARADAAAGRPVAEPSDEPRLHQPLPTSVNSDGWDIGGIDQGGQEGQLAGLAETGSWQGISKGVEVAVLAGSTAVDSAFNFGPVGVIVVQTRDGQSAHGTFTRYKNGTYPGPWTIVSGAHNMVTLKDAKGTAFTFDADSLTFGKSMHSTMAQ